MSWNNSWQQQSNTGYQQPQQPSVVQPRQNSWMTGGQNVQPQAAQVQAQQKFMVTTSGNDQEEFAIKMLLGEFAQKGSNHEKPFYQKQGIQAIDGACFLYYWDHRDGPAFEGWWFGRAVGGNEVWSHNVNGASPTPPRQGWKIPFAGSVRDTLSVVPQAEHAKNQVAAQAQVTQNKLNVLKGEARTVIQAANAALANARGRAGDYSDMAKLEAAEGLLAPHLLALPQLQKKFETSGLGPNDVRQSLQEIKMALTQINSEKGKIQLTKPKIRETAQQAQNAAADQEKLQSIIEDATKFANEAEDMVEKAVIAAEMIEAAGSDVKEAQAALVSTEAAVKLAFQSVTKALTNVNVTAAKKNQLRSQEAKSQADIQIEQLRKGLQDSQAKLSKVKTARQDFNQRNMVTTLTKEILEKLTVAEVEVDKIEETVTVQLEEDTPSKDAQAAAEKAIRGGMEIVNNVLKFIELKRGKATFDLAKVELEKIETRTKKSLTRLNGFRGRLQEVKEKITASSLMSDVGEKVTQAKDAVDKLAKASSELKGTEDLPLNEALERIKSLETVTASATKLVNNAKIGIRMKDVETKRFSADAAKQAQKQLGDFKTKMEALTKRLDVLKATVKERQSKAVTKALEGLVKEAVKQSEKLTEAAVAFGDEAKIESMSAEDARSAAEEFAEAHTGTTNSVTAAQQILTEQMIASKAAESSVDSAGLAKYQTRLRSAQSVLNAHKTLPEPVQRQLMVKKAVEEANAKMKLLGERVAVVVKIGEQLGKASKGNDIKTEERASKADFDSAVLAARSFLRTLPKFLELQKRSKPGIAAELDQLVNELQKPAEEKLEAAIQALRGTEDKKALETVKAEVEPKIVEAEKAVESAAELAKPLLEDPDSSDDEKVKAEKESASLATFDGGVQAANKVLTGAKTFIAIKRLAAKKMAGSLQVTMLEVLALQQGRVDKAVAQLTQIRRSTTQKKYAAALKDITDKVQEAETKVKEASAANAALGESAEKSEDAQKVKADLVAAGKAHVEADLAISSARQFVHEQLRDLKSKGGAAADSGILDEFRKLLEDLVPLQESLDKEKVSVSDHEQSFVAKRLQKGADDFFQKLEAKVKHADEAAAPLLSGKKEEFVASVSLSMAVMKLRSSKKTADKLYDEIRGKQSKVTKDTFVAFMLGLAKDGEPSATLTEDQLKSSFSFLSSGADEVDQKEFIRQLKPRYLCLDTVCVSVWMAAEEGSDTSRKLEPGDVVEGLEEPVLDKKTGALRVHIKREADGMKGFATISASGTTYLEPYTLYAASQRTAKAAFKDVGETANHALAYLKQKTEEIQNSGRSGPLADVRVEFTKMRTKASKSLGANMQLEKRVVEAMRELDSVVEAERRRTQEAADKAAAAIVMKVANDSVEEVAGEVEKTISKAEGLLANKFEGQDDPLKVIDAALKELEEVVKSVDEVLEKVIKPKLDEIPSAAKGPFVEARRALFKLKVKLNPCHAKCGKLITSLQLAREQVCADAHRSLKDLLRSHLQSSGTSAHALFDKLAKGSDALTVKVLQVFLKGIVADKLTPARLDMGLQRYASTGLSRLSFLMATQEFLECTKDIALTNNFDVKTSTTTRKLEMGEVVEVIGESKKDEGVGLDRVKCRALIDGIEGFVTLRGNQGTAFMKPMAKPFHMCQAEAPLFKACDSAGDEACKLKPGDVIEMIQSPTPEAVVEVQRVRGRTMDGKMGWATLSDFKDSATDKLLVCSMITAITTVFDIAESKAVRKVEVGELLIQLEEPKEDSARSLTRVRVKAKKEGPEGKNEGWVTMKGNQGTAFVSEATSHKECRHATPLQTQLASDSKVLRMLEEGEIFEVKDGPKVERKEGTLLAKGRNVSNGKEGWFACEAFVKWSPTYTCVRSTDLKDGVGDTAKVLRALEVSESLCALQPPTTSENGTIHVQVQAERDGAVGFALVNEVKLGSLGQKSCKVFLKSAIGGSSGLTSY